MQFVQNAMTSIYEKLFELSSEGKGQISYT